MLILSSFVPDASSKTSTLRKYSGMSTAFPQTSKSHETIINSSLKMFESWCNTPIGLSIDRGIFLGFDTILTGKMMIFSEFEYLL